MVTELFLLIAPAVLLFARFKLAELGLRATNATDELDKSLGVKICLLGLFWNKIGVCKF